MTNASSFQNEFRFVFFAPVDKFEATIAFYRDVLQMPILGGFGESPQEMRGRYVQAAKGVFEIIADPSESAFKAKVLQPGEQFVPAKGGYFLIEVEDVDALYERLIGQGVPVFQEITNWPWNFRDFKVADPCGNILCLFSRR